MQFFFKIFSLTTTKCQLEMEMLVFISLKCYFSVWGLWPRGRLSVMDVLSIIVILAGKKWESCRLNTLVNIPLSLNTPVNIPLSLRLTVQQCIVFISDYFDEMCWQRKMRKMMQSFNPIFPPLSASGFIFCAFYIKLSYIFFSLVNWLKVWLLYNQHQHHKDK